MKAIRCAVLSVLLFATAASAESVSVAVTARAGVVDGTRQNSDEFMWGLFTQFAAPLPETKPPAVLFETWASDADTFSKTPHWPSSQEPRKFHASVLASFTTPHVSSPIDVPCGTPGNAAVGGFPTSGDPKPCIAEETKRNRPQFDYIVNNKLNTQAGLAAAFKQGFKVVMPTESISVKGDWAPLTTLLKWIPSLENVAKIRELYYTATVGGVEYALVSLHVSSRQNPNWVWGTFEHEMNPGRCDNLGCLDSFGAKKPAVLPHETSVNDQYGRCEKTERLKVLMRSANLSPVWENYCLKSTQVDYSAPDHTPYALGNSVIERIVGNGTVSASSCIACHAYASFGANGQPTSAATAMLPYNPTGAPIAGVLEGAQQFDFMWGVLLAP